MYTLTDLSNDLEEGLTTGFDVDAVSDLAFAIYHNHCLQLAESVVDVLVTLMVMGMG
ncbi:hypothetical protein [Stenotrophomonas sp. HMWF023]|uniref:hypothetical protein n=1 Tax=Stenotrophomonas sp. HMWF023 TaxID=2056859 RepID=UPI0015E854B2|nr:hypothetical protein [Stenotrophomonas sp. HMWF023]